MPQLRGNEPILGLNVGTRPKGKKNDRGKESVQKTEVTTGKRTTRAHARKRAQRKVTAGGRTTRAWEKYLT
jgi:hypothetical protein